MAQRTRSQGRRSGGGRGRSWQVPLSVAVIAISVVAIWQLSSGLFDNDSTSTPSEPDQEITAFWVDSGRDLLTDWRNTSPEIVQDIATGRDCLQGEEFTAAVCPDLPQHYQDYRLRLGALVDRAAGLAPPPDSSAEEWLARMVSAWTALDSSLRTYAQLGRDGYERQPWLDHQASYRDEVVPGFTEAEFALARMLGEVDPTMLSPAAP